MSFINPNTILIINRGMNPNTITSNAAAIDNDNTNFKYQIIASIAGGNAMLPMNPGFELHPYKGQLTFTNQSKIIIGTFPPISYFIDIIAKEGLAIRQLRQPTHPHQVITKPNIPFFHGNVSGLWSVLLPDQDYIHLKELQINDRVAAREYLINWLYANSIYYDDIISYTQRKFSKLAPQNNLGYTYEDVNLKNICPDINLVQNLLINQNLNVVCFTNGATFRSGNNGGLKLYSAGARLGLVNTGNSDALSLFLRTCQEMGLIIEMRCMPHFNWTALNHLTEVQKRTKLIFELRVTKPNNITLPALQTFLQKEFVAISPYSPAAHGNIEVHPIVQSLRQVYGLNQTAAQLLPKIYTQFRNDNYQELFQFNINQ